ncbi:MULTISPECIES: hypothetical protein [unclassified Streptomyces]|uniref:hypothetical protein n=1 Tax=unclassified Streptomyces TaxID=2593676 RepID=UPI00095C91F5|nr:hypothetical protein AMK10_34975 [Streptomyces sp. CB02058]
MSTSDTTSPAVLEQLQQRSADPKRRIPFTGATIVAMDADLGVLHGADLLVVGDTITAIGTGLDRDGSVVVDAAGTILPPGFVDTHRHARETQLRRIMPDVDDLGAYAMSTLAGYATVRTGGAPHTLGMCGTPLCLPPGYCSEALSRLRVACRLPSRASACALGLPASAW